MLTLLSLLVNIFQNLMFHSNVETFVTSCEYSSKFNVSLKSCHFSHEQCFLVNNKPKYLPLTFNDKEAPNSLKKLLLYRFLSDPGIPGVRSMGPECL